MSSRLDHHNSLLYGLPKYLTTKLQRIQNHAARLVCRARKYEHIQPLLKTLHWLPVDARIKYKILLLTYKCIQGTAPEYLCQLLQRYRPARPLRSEDQVLLRRGKPRTKTYGQRAFRNCAPALPSQVRSIDSLDSFKSAIKTYLFRIHFKCV